MHVVTFKLRPSIRLRAALFCALFGFWLLPLHTNAQEQDDVAAAARQERARKAEQRASAPHVYSDEDLHREKILLPQDQARVEARKKQKSAARAEENAAIASAPDARDAEAPQSLGEVARHLREANQPRGAAKTENNGFAPFPYNVAPPVVAAPKSGEPLPIAPSPSLSRPDTQLGLSLRLAPRASSPVSREPRWRASPFTPRPLVIAPVPRRADAMEPTAALRKPETALPVGRVAARSVTSNDTRRITVRRGDSWWKLARQYLGSGARWGELRNLNAQDREVKGFLREGALVEVPVMAVAGGNAVSGDLRAILRVEKGDTLWSLAREHLGRASAWPCLVQVNPEIRGYHRLAIGQVLRLPPSQDCSRLGATLSPRSSK
jgi:nucleoid-associated protein YgaU